MRIAAFAAALLWLLADYFSKQWALLALDGQPMTLTDWMNFKLAFNHGAAFSFLADFGGWQRWLFMGIALVVSVWLIHVIIVEHAHKVTKLGYGFILGGALGNAYDRIVHGYVVDFIQWHYGRYYWPTFNVADVAISIGVALLIVSYLFLQVPKR